MELLNTANRDVHLGNLKTSDMEILLHSGTMAMSEEDFENLPIYGFHNSAPCNAALWKSGGLCKFTMPGSIDWLIGRPRSRRSMTCWVADFPPSVSYKDEAANNMVQAMSVAIPETAGLYGTLVGAKLLTCALNSVSVETLQMWIDHKKKRN